ncbi:MAG: hypothetical protein AB8I08_23565 [Sandaracinaceae bacterium]
MGKPVVTTRCRWLLTLVALALVGCSSTARLAWPSDVRAAAERGPEIRPPEAWAPAPAADAFHARGWFVLTESWNTDMEAGPIGHCWRGTVRTIGDAGGDVTASDFHDHGLEDLVMGAVPLDRDGLTLWADDRSFTACDADPGEAGTVEAAVDGLMEECAAFGDALRVTRPHLAGRARSVRMAMNAIELTLEIRFEAAPGGLPIDELTRRLVARGFHGEATAQMGDPPMMLRDDDGWDVRLTLPPEGQTEVTLWARTRVPRRPMCGPAPLPPPRPL